MTRIVFEGLVNARDVGGIPAGEGRVISQGRLLRSETPQLMTPADVTRAVEELNVNRVVDLRSPADGGSGPLGADGRGVSVSFFDLAPGSRGPGVDRTADGFLPGQLDHAAPVVGRVFEQLVDHDGATLVHCRTGKDRTGFVIAVTLAVLGASDADIIADYGRSASCFDAMNANLDAAGMPLADGAPEFARARPSTVGITELLRQLRTRWPTPVAYLTEHGVDPALADTVVDRLTEPNPEGTTA